MKTFDGRRNRRSYRTGKANLMAMLFALAMVSAAATNALAAYNVVIGTTSTNGSWSGSIWMPSASGSTVSAAEIETRLGSGSVTIATSGGGAEAGDIFVSSAVSWTANTLTLNAQNDINIKVNLNGSGTASLALQYGQANVNAGNASNYYLSNGAKVSLPAGTNFSTKLGSDGATTTYTVITRLGSSGSVTTTDLQGMSGDLTGNYALGADIDATATSGWNAGAGFAPVGTSGTSFTGNFAGLGHTISNLTINRLTTPYIGLFGYATTGTLRDVGLLNSSISGQSVVGALAGYNSGTVEYVYASGGSVTADFHLAGGLVGQTGATSSISDSYATDSVIGNNNGVNSTGIGGLVGQLAAGGSISNSYATGSVDTASTGKDVGGLVGQAVGGTVSDSYATGTVSGTQFVGGLAGSNGGGGTSATFTNDYWDTTTSGQASSYGGSGLTTTQMQTMASFASWSIANSGGSSAMWRIYEGQSYPLLRNFLAQLTVTANNDSKVYDGLAYSGGNGVSYSVTPNAYLLGSVSYGGSAQGAINVGSYAITPAGFYSASQMGYDISYVDGSLTINPVVSGVCGSDNGQLLSTIPTNLCANGTPSVVSGTGPWTWTCYGASGGSDASCSALLMPDGDLNNDGTVDSADALEALRIASGIDTATAANLANGDVAPLIGGVPNPNGTINTGDVVVILRKAVGLITW